MAIDFLALFDGLGLIWQASKTDELSNDGGSQSCPRQTVSDQPETKSWGQEREQVSQDRREEMQARRRQRTNTSRAKRHRRR